MLCERCKGRVLLSDYGNLQTVAKSEDFHVIIILTSKMTNDNDLIQAWLDSIFDLHLLPIHHVVVASIHNGPKHLSHQTQHVTILATHSLRSHQNIVPSIAMSSSSNTP